MGVEGAGLGGLDLGEHRFWVVSPTPSILRKVFGALGLSLDFGVWLRRDSIFPTGRFGGEICQIGDLDSSEEAARVEGAVRVELVFYGLHEGKGG